MNRYEAQAADVLAAEVEAESLRRERQFRAAYRVATFFAGARRAAGVKA